jgi:hypothetical protein
LIAAGVAIFVFTTLTPPWNRMHLEMQEMLYGASREVSVLEAKSAGHRPWFMVPQAVEIGRNTPGNFYRFERIEYRIDWFDLGWQWGLGAALVITGILTRNYFVAAPVAKVDTVPA